MRREPGSRPRAHGRPEFRPPRRAGDGDGKLFHIDLNDQEFGRYDQDFRFGQANLKHAFFLVKLLEDNKYNGPRHFDAHALRTERLRRTCKAFARGCMRTYMILKEKAKQWNTDTEDPGPARNEINAARLGAWKGSTRKYSSAAQKMLAGPISTPSRLANKALPYERLDQTMGEVLMGVR